MGSVTLCTETQEFKQVRSVYSFLVCLDKTTSWEIPRAACFLCPQGRSVVDSSTMHEGVSDLALRSRQMQIPAVRLVKEF
jgi:hypothetical protein